MLAQQLVGARGGGAGDVERGRVEPAPRRRCRSARARRAAAPRRPGPRAGAAAAANASAPESERRDPAVPCSSCFPPVVVWRSGEREERTNAEDSVKGVRGRGGAACWSAAGSALALTLQVGEHRRRHRRRLHADDAAEARVRADQAARLRQDLAPPTARLPPVLETITIWFDKHGAVETRGLPVCTAGETGGDDDRRGAQALPGRDRRHRLRQGGGQLPRTAADPGLLADHDLQRAAEERQPDRARPRPPDRARRRPPSSSRSRSRRSTTAATASRPWPRSRRSPTAPARRSTAG